MIFFFRLILQSLKNSGIFFFHTSSVHGHVRLIITFFFFLNIWIFLGWKFSPTFKTLQWNEISQQKWGKSREKKKPLRDDKHVSRHDDVHKDLFVCFWLVKKESVRNLFMLGYCAICWNKIEHKYYCKYLRSKLLLISINSNPPKPAIQLPKQWYSMFFRYSSYPKVCSFSQSHQKRVTKNVG